jgi:hypothetical protein
VSHPLLDRPLEREAEDGRGQETSATTPPAASSRARFPDLARSAIQQRARPGVQRDLEPCAAPVELGVGQPAATARA